MVPPVVQQLAIFVTHYPETKVDPVAHDEQMKVVAVPIALAIPAVQFVEKLAVEVAAGELPKMATEVMVVTQTTVLAVLASAAVVGQTYVRRAEVHATVKLEPVVSVI